MPHRSVTEHLLIALLLLIAAGVLAASGERQPTQTAVPPPAAPPQTASPGPDATPETIAAYKKHCAMCHLPAGDAVLMDMSFVDDKWKHGAKLKEIAQIITDGVPGTSMIGFKTRLTEAEILLLAKYVRAFDKTLKPEKTP